MNEQHTKEHTSEPWFFGTISPDFKRTDEPAGPELAICSQTGSADKPDGTIHGNIICRGMDGPTREANARRIVAAINACHGVPTEVLEDVNSSERELLHHYVEALSHNTLLREQNKNLLARVAVLEGALKEAQQAFMEIHAARRNGPEWFTKGREGQQNHIELWISKGSAAARSALQNNGVSHE